MKPTSNGDRPSVRRTSSLDGPVTDADGPLAAAWRVQGYWAETVARSPDAGGEWHLGGWWAPGAWGALTWIRQEGLRLGHALGPGCEAASVFRDWAADTAYLRVQLAALLAGRPVSVNTCGPDRICAVGQRPGAPGAGTGGAVEVLYSISARPVRRHPRALRFPRPGHPGAVAPTRSPSV
ncbi:hypothetical protein [Streptomyces spiramenti]|uniref:Uncharacterized protein n=1 Tax=Streptomyces spiramenti TaxID=2720606 RepID=A0ABX1AHG0_9ACTN|nr:hypothetical protein [Streptomyces spiramenti]NJP66607.1 hypothetical protein [Streptomyces spiramenti]